MLTVTVTDHWTLDQRVTKARECRTGIPGSTAAGARVLHFLCLGVVSGIEFTLTFPDLRLYAKTPLPRVVCAVMQLMQLMLRARLLVA
jgi:hypothetical protein